MAPSQYKRIVLNERPLTNIEPNTFRTELHSFTNLSPGDGQVVVQVTWLSLDPAMRGYLRDARSYLPPVQIGETMRGLGIGTVIEAGNGSKFKIGDAVSGAFGWTEFALMKDKDLTPLVLGPGIQVLDYLNTLGSSGLTAYFGLKDVGKIKAGETLLVSGAAGSVGAIVCQLGKKLGAKVYAIAGSPEKCEWLEKELGVIKAYNYKSPTFQKDLRSMGYLDVFFDNVGGEILDMALTRLNQGARIVLCGAISGYNDVKPRGLQNYMTLIGQRATLQGFIVFDYKDRYPEAIAEISKGLADGTIKRKFHIVEGIEQAPVALPLLFSGGNTGKLVVKISEEPKAKY